MADHSIIGYYDAEFVFFDFYEPSNHKNENTKKWKEKNLIKDAYGNQYSFITKMNLQVKGDRLPEFENKKVFRVLDPTVKDVEVHKDGKVIDTKRAVDGGKNPDFYYLIGAANSDAEYRDMYGSNANIGEYFSDSFDCIVVKKVVNSVKYKEGRDDVKDEWGNEWENQVDEGEMRMLSETYNMGDYEDFGGVGGHIDDSELLDASLDRYLGDGNVWGYMNQNLHNDVSLIYDKFISYDMYMQANSFAKLFDIKLDPYTGSNYKMNSCFINLIIDTYHCEFEKRKKDGKRMYKELTYKYLMEILELEDKVSDIGLSIRRSIKFFSKFSIGLEVINVFGQMLFSYVPEKPNNKIANKTLRILVHDGHCYKLDKDACYKIRDLRVKYGDLEDFNEMNEIDVGERYRFNENVETDNGLKAVFINSLDEIAVKLVEIVRSSEIVPKIVKFITLEDMNSLLVNMLEVNYTPKISFNCGRIKQLAFKINGVEAIIESSDSRSPDNISIQLEDVEIYENFHKANQKFLNSVLVKNVMSNYNKEVLDFEEEYSSRPSFGRIGEDECKLFNCIDVNKAYTSMLYDLMYVPVFDYFDNYKEYNGEEIEDLNMYFIKCTDSSRLSVILFGSTYTRCYGIVVKKARELRVSFDIILVKRPSNIVEVNYKQYIDELYLDESIEVKHKKQIVNVTTGLMEKRYNKVNICKIFNNENEAHYFQIKYGGRIMSLLRENGEVFYLFVCKKEKRLVEGFRSIKELIYDKMSIRMSLLYNEVVTKGLRVRGIKTDCIMVEEDVNLIEGLFEFNNEIGGIKLEKDKVLPCKEFARRDNKYTVRDREEINYIKVNSEMDTDELNTIFRENTRVLVKGLYPGVGKTTAVRNFGDQDNKILFVTPFNRLAQELRKDGFDAVTLYRLLGYFGGFAGGVEYKKKNRFDVRDYHCICFDEVALYSPHLLKKIDVYMRNHSDIRFLSTGDLDQLQPFDFWPNNIGDDIRRSYLESCVNFVFREQIVLKENKRLLEENQKEILASLKKDIFSEDDIISTLRKYNFKFSSDINETNTLVNICYFNHRTVEVNSIIHEKVKRGDKVVRIGDIDYWPGLELICKKHYKHKGKGIRLFVNFVYKLVAINTEIFTIRDENEKENITLDICHIDKFSLPYANTCHSVQGLSINGDITIFDINIPHVDKFFIWTALTRCVDFGKVTIFIHSNNEIDILRKSRMKLYWEGKINGYKRQDIIRGRSVENFIDIKWLINMININKVCIECRMVFETTVKDGIVSSNITVDRINNELGHVLGNCRLLCIDCNRKRANHY